MTPAALADLVLSCADDVLTRRGLDPAVLPGAAGVERTRHRDHGEYVTMVALRAAREVRVPPRELAGWLAQALAASPAVRSAEVAGPGFVNLRLSDAARGEIVWQVLAAGSRYGTDGGPRWASGESWPAAERVRYAHSRLAALIRNAACFGITSVGASLGPLVADEEKELVLALSEFPACVAASVRCDRPGRVRCYLERLAEASWVLTESCRVLPMGDEEPGPRHAARLALCRATRQVLSNGLGLLGSSAPERM